MHMHTLHKKIPEGSCQAVEDSRSCLRASFRDETNNGTLSAAGASRKGNYLRGLMTLVGDTERGAHSGLPRKRWSC